MSHLPCTAVSSRRSLVRVLIVKAIVLALVAPTIAGAGSFRVDELCETEVEFKEKLEEGLASKRGLRIRPRHRKYKTNSTLSLSVNRLRYSNVPERVDGHRLSNGLLAPLTC